MLFEIPITHLLLHFLVSPTAAKVATLLSLLGFMFWLGEYRAMTRRPFLLNDQQLIIRFGLFNDVEVPLKNI